MYIPRGQAKVPLFTRSFLAFCVRRGWPARLVQHGSRKITERRNHERGEREREREKERERGEGEGGREKEGGGEEMKVSGREMHVCLGVSVYMEQGLCDILWLPCTHMYMYTYMYAYHKTNLCNCVCVCFACVSDQCACMCS